MVVEKTYEFQKGSSLLLVKVTKDDVLLWITLKANTPQWVSVRDLWVFDVYNLKITTDEAIQKLKDKHHAQFIEMMALLKPMKVSEQDEYITKEIKRMGFSPRHWEDESSN